jgi:hypothetical protein
MIKSVAIVNEIPLAGGQFISIEIADEEGKHTQILYFDEEELLNAAALNEKGCLDD